MIQKPVIITTNSQHDRQGAALIMAIIALMICTSISLSMFKTTTLRQQHFVNRYWKLQTELIADSALERAAQQLTSDPNYTGETWTVTTNGEQGTATIQIIDSDQGRHQVKIVARYPSKIATRAQVTLEAEVKKITK